MTIWLWFHIFSFKENVMLATKQVRSFDPTTFIDPGWSYVHDPRSATLGLLDDYSKVKLSTDWLQGQSVVDGETRRVRILTQPKRISLNADHFFDIWANPKKFVLSSWKGVITFDGGVLLDPSGESHTLFLYWDGLALDWGFGTLKDKYGPDYLSAYLEI